MKRQRGGRRIGYRGIQGLSQQTPEAVLAARIDVATECLQRGGNLNDAIAIRGVYRKRRWRMLVELLEFMETHGYEQEVIDEIRNWRPTVHQNVLDIETAARRQEILDRIYKGGSA